MILNKTKNNRTISKDIRRYSYLLNSFFFLKFFKFISYSIFSANAERNVLFLQYYLSICYIKLHLENSFIYLLRIFLINSLRFFRINVKHRRKNFDADVSYLFRTIYMFSQISDFLSSFSS